MIEKIKNVEKKGQDIKKDLLIVSVVDSGIGIKDED